MTLATTSHNSWFHHLQATTCRNMCGNIMLRTALRNARCSSQNEPQFVLSTQD